MAKTSTSFKKGEIHNAKGRPKKEWTMRGLIREAMEEFHESGVPWKKVMTNKLVSLAVSGDIVAIKEVNNRLDGMPQQDVTSGGEAIKSMVMIDTIPEKDSL